jgi:glycosyltransferase involved in cell wall biosynthesis
VRITFLLRTLTDRATSKLTLALASEIANRGHDVTILSFNRGLGAPIDVPNIHLRDLGTGERISFRAIGHLAKWMRDSRPDIMFCQGTGPGGAAVLSRAVLAPRFPIVVIDHDPPTAGRSRLEKLVRGADVLAAPSPQAAERFAARAGVENPVVLPNPVQGPLEEKPKSVGPWYSNHRPVVCCVANLIPRKGQDVLIRALEFLHAHLVLVGRFDDPEYFAHLQRLAEEGGVTDRVWFAGYQPDPLPFMYHADAFALASRSEAAPLVLVEAMASGIPVVATDCPEGPRWILNDGAAGILVEVDDAKAMAEGLRVVLTEEDSRRRFVEAGKERAAEFSLESAADHYIDLLNLKKVTDPWRSLYRVVRAAE